MGLEQPEQQAVSLEQSNQIRENFGTAIPGELIKVRTESSGFLGEVRSTGKDNLTVEVDTGRPSLGGQRLVIRYKGDDLPSGVFKYSVVGGDGSEKDSSKLTGVSFPHRPKAGPTL